MEIYFSFQAALCFSIAHIFIRRGLVESNAMTGSFISLSTTATVLWLLFPFFAGLSDLWTPASLIFVAAGIFAPGIGRTMSYVGIEKIGVARSVPIANSSPIFASILAVIFLAKFGYCRISSGRCWSSAASLHCQWQSPLKGGGANST